MYPPRLLFRAELSNTLASTCHETTPTSRAQKALAKIEAVWVEDAGRVLFDVVEDVE